MNATTKQEAGALAVFSGASAGALLMSSDAMDRIERIAEFMASGKTTVPQHLRGSKGDCFAITLQSMQWGMNPFAVGQKTHLVNGVLGYEAQLVAAVINNSGVVRDRFNFDWFGPWDKVIGKFTIKRGDKGDYRVPGWTMADEEGCGIKVWATLKGESRPRELTLLLAQARTRNSTLWADDPKQQLAYLAQKRWARLYAPDVILGVYTGDELEQPAEKFMGEADVVSPPAAPTGYPADDFAANYEKWAKHIAAGRKTMDGIVAMVETKGKLTDEQKRQLSDAVAALAPQVEDVKPKGEPENGAPTITYAEVASRLHAATNTDELAEAGSLVSAVAEPQQREELNALYDQRANDLF